MPAAAIPGSLTTSGRCPSGDDLAQLADRSGAEGNVRWRLKGEGVG